MWVLSVHFPQQREPVLFGHMQIGDDYVGIQGLGKRERVPHRARARDLGGCVRQDETLEADHVLVVVYDEDPASAKGIGGINANAPTGLAQARRARLWS